MWVMFNQPNKNKLGDFVAMPRSLARNFRDKKLSKDSYIILTWLWINANPFGIFTNCSYRLLADTFNWSENKVNKIMLAELKQNYIQYSLHRGSRTPFDVKIIGFLTSKGTITTSSQDENYDPSRTQTITPGESTVELLPELEDFKQNSEIKESKRSLIKNLRMKNHLSRTPNNDNNNDNNKKDKIFLNFPYKEELIRDGLSKGTLQTLSAYYKESDITMAVSSLKESRISISYKTVNDFLKEGVSNGSIIALKEPL